MICSSRSFSFDCSVDSKFDCLTLNCLVVCHVLLLVISIQFFFVISETYCSYGQPTLKRMVEVVHASLKQAGKQLSIKFSLSFVSSHYKNQLELQKLQVARD